MQPRPWIVSSTPWVVQPSSISKLVPCSIGPLNTQLAIRRFAVPSSWFPGLRLVLLGSVIRLVFPSTFDTQPQLPFPAISYPVISILGSRDTTPTDSLSTRCSMSFRANQDPRRSRKPNTYSQFTVKGSAITEWSRSPHSWYVFLTTLESLVSLTAAPRPIHLSSNRSPCTRNVRVSPFGIGPGRSRRRLQRKM